MVTDRSSLYCTSHPNRQKSNRINPTTIQASLLLRIQSNENCPTSTVFSYLAASLSFIWCGWNGSLASLTVVKYWSSMVINQRESAFSNDRRKISHLFFCFSAAEIASPACVEFHSNQAKIAQRGFLRTIPTPEKPRPFGSGIAVTNSQDR